MAPFAGFIGPSYTGRAMAADAERSINLYLEKVESQTGATKSEFVLLSKPGLSVFCNLPSAASVLASFQSNGRAFAIAGGQLYELFAGGTYTNRGAVGNGTTQMDANQKQLFIVAGNNGFIFDLTSNTLSQITAAGWIPGSQIAGNIDGYFICYEPNSQQFIISGLNDGTSWDALDYGDAEGETGNLVGAIADHRQLWLMCTDHAEVYYDSGDSNFAFSRLEGAFMETGLIAPASLKRCDNTIFWLGGDEKGAGIVWRANGYTPQRISNHALEAAIQSYPAIADATAYVYQDGGHTFYCLHFPSANNGQGWTWAYDCATETWHERAYWSNGQYIGDLARTHCFAFGQHLAGDWRSGNIYVMSQSVYTDNGAPIRRLRSAPDLANGGRWTFYTELRLLMQVGVGLDGGVTPGSNPQIILQVSNDGGFTWGNERSVSMGQLGQYSTLVRWRQLGRSQNRAFRVVVSEPVFVALVSADLDAH